MRSVNIPIIFVIIFLSVSACSNGGNAPVSPLNLPDGTGQVGSLDSLPVIAFDGETALGLFGAFNLMLSPTKTDAELVPMRSPAIGESYIVSGSAFFTMTPCSDCLKISSISLSLEENIILGFKVKHPFPAGDPLKPPTARNRNDLDVFDLALIVVPLEKTADNYPLIGASIYPNILLNANGYTTELSNVIDDPSAMPYKICYEDANNNRFAMGNDYQNFDIVLEPESGLLFNLYLTMGYGASAKKAQRLTPTYYVPEFNRKSAWKILVTPPEGSDPPAMGNTWDDSDSTTPYPVTIDIYDWNHGATVASAYPDPANTDQISATSDVTSVTVEIPGMTSTLVSATTSDTTTNGWDDPLTYVAEFPNENGLDAGAYIGLVKVTDSRVPGTSNIGGESDTLVHTDDGIVLQWMNIPEFATYQTFQATVVVGGLPPVCDIHTDKDTTGQGETIYADPGTSNDPDGTITTYEYDSSYDGTTFNPDVTQIYTDPDFGDPVSLVMPCNATPENIINTVAIRVTDNNVPPLSSICTKNITITPKMGCPLKVTADTVNRGESIPNQYRITSIDLDWPDNPCAAEFAIERANDAMNPSFWTVLATTTSSSYKFQPTNVQGIDRMRVKARAVVGGNPATDSDPSGEVLLIFDSHYFSTGHSWIQTNEHANGSSWNFNTSTWGFTSLDDSGDGGYGMCSLEWICIDGQCGSWPNCWCAFITLVPDIVDQDASYVDMYYSQFSWNFGNTAAMMLGTASGILTDNQPTAPDFNGVTRHRAYSQYNNQCEALDVEFGESNAWGFSNFMPWTHVSYWLDDLLDDGSRDYFGMGWANGDLDGYEGCGYNDAQVVVVY